MASFTKKPLAYGLNVAKKKSTPSSSRPSIFQHDESDDESSQTKSSPKATSQRQIVNKQIASMSSYRTKKEQEIQKKALEDDPTVFDYDGVYDQMKAKESKKKNEFKKDDGKKPKYMDNLLKTAELRKLERMRVLEKKLQKEREEEEEEYGNSEAFVTGAYKAKLEEIRRLEEEERIREEQDKKSDANGMSKFYRSMLDRTAATHEAAMQLNPDEEESETKPADADEDDPLKKLSPEELAARGIEVNDSMEVVDKRQLLVGGLNIVKKPKAVSSGADAVGSRASGSSVGRYMTPKQKELERKRAREVQEKMLEQQKEIEEKKKQEEEQLKAKMVKRNTDDTISDAKARYLARLAEKKKQTESVDNE